MFFSDKTFGITFNECAFSALLTIPNLFSAVAVDLFVVTFLHIYLLIVHVRDISKFRKYVFILRIQASIRISLIILVVIIL